MAPASPSRICSSSRVTSWVGSCLVEFSSVKSAERINRALRVFPKSLLMRLLAFSLHLLGASRKAVAALVDMPDESVKTAVRLAMRDGFPALRDRRRSKEGPPAAVQASPLPVRFTARQEGEMCVVELGNSECSLSIPAAFRIQAKTVLLSLFNAKLLSAQEVASALGLHTSHCRELARKLARYDVLESLADKRQGQRQDYLVGPEQKAEIVLQLAARAITGQSISSDVLAEAVHEKTHVGVSARTIRWHIQKLGLARIKKTLPQRVEALKKTS